MNKLMNRLIWLVAVVPAIYLAIIWNTIPATVAMHFDINGKPDRFGDKSELIILVLILLAVSIGVYFLMANINRIDPKRYAAENTLRFKKIGFAVSIFLSGLTCFIIYSSTHGGSKMDVNLILAAVSLLLAVIGNYMPNLKPNYFAGMRLPWTLESPANWRATHILAGRIWFYGGLALTLLCFLLPPKPATIVFIGGILLMVLIPTVYSWQYYQKNKNSSGLS